MQHGARLRAEHHRDIATRFRLMAEIEPLASLRRHLRRLAAQHDELAAGLETAQPMNQDNPRAALGWPIRARRRARRRL
jgi:hypothetical protein